MSLAKACLNLCSSFENSLTSGESAAEELWLPDILSQQSSKRSTPISSPFLVDAAAVVECRWLARARVVNVEGTHNDLAHASSRTQSLRDRVSARIPVNVIMEQSPVAWPLPFSDMLSWRSWPRAASLLQLRLSTIRTDSIQVIRTGLGSIVIKAELFGLGSILIRSDDGADVGLGDLRVAVFFFLQSWIFEALGSIIRSWRRNFLWRSTAVGLLCDYGSRLLDRVRWWPPHMVSLEIVSNMKRWTVWWR